MLRDRTKVELGNGRETSFFNANWHEYGPLCNMEGVQLFKKKLLLPEGRVADMIVDGKWCWDREHQRMDETCKRIAGKIGTPPILGGAEDRLIWMPDKTGDFTLRSAIQSLGPVSQDVEWANQVWWGKRIPRYAFIQWMVHWKRLPTADRMIKWGLEVDPTCCLCGDLMETHEHLFFSCRYARRVWAAVMTYCGMKQVPVAWEERHKWLRTRPGHNSFQKDLILLANSVTTYSIWWERNKRKNENQCRGHKNLSLDIKNTIRICAGEWRGVRRTHANWARYVEMGISLLVLRKLERKREEKDRTLYK